jgi:hypothetical protein
MGNMTVYGTTKLFTAPEMGSRNYTNKVDVFSFGIVMGSVICLKEFDNLNQLKSAVRFVNQELAELVRCVIRIQIRDQASKNWLR